MYSKIDIKFDGRSENVFYTGETITGRVEVKFEKAKRLRGISFQICGFAKTCWDGTASNKYVYCGAENYLLSRKYLIGSDLDSPQDLAPGTYIYNFSCTLPKQLPSSFEGLYGHIRYVAKVILERPLKFDQTHTIGFTVLRPLDLNLESPLLRVPNEVEVLHKFWSFACTSNPIHIKGKLKQSGYVPGQIINLQVEVNNPSNVDVKEVRIRLQCLISYQADTPRLKCRQDVMNLVSKKCGPVHHNTNATFEEELTVPPVSSSSNSDYSKMIQVSYCIRIEAVSTHLHKNAYVLFPLTIGTVPFIDGRHQPPPSYSPGGTQLSGDGVLLSPIRNLEMLAEYNIEPPSYQEAVHATRVQVNVGDNGAIERTVYVPKYPFYNFETDSNKNGMQALTIAE